MKWFVFLFNNAHCTYSKHIERILQQHQPCCQVPNLYTNEHSIQQLTAFCNHFGCDFHYFCFLLTFLLFLMFICPFRRSSNANKSHFKCYTVYCTDMSNAIRLYSTGTGTQFSQWKSHLFAYRFWCNTSIKHWWNSWALDGEYYYLSQHRHFR